MDPLVGVVVAFVDEDDVPLSTARVAISDARSCPGNGDRSSAPGFVAYGDVSGVKSQSEAGDSRAETGKLLDRCKSANLKAGSLLEV